METKMLAWISVGAYVLLTAYLAFKGWRKSKNLESYAVGAKDISPIVIGLSLSASLTSVATFVTNPGLVYKYGISAIFGFGVAAAMGIMIGLIFFSKAFRTYGAQVSALTIPQWIGNRYKSKGLSISFAILSLALVTFAVLIVVALAHILHALLGVSTTTISLAIILFVFSYVMLGGVNTHAYTNAIQAVIMIIVAVLLLGTGITLLWKGDGILAGLGAIDKNLVTVTNVASPFFRNWFEVFFCNFLIGLALVCQPHTLSKTLYLKDNKDIRKFLLTAVIVGGLFAMVMVVGLFARYIFENLPQPLMNVPMDKVIAYYIGVKFTGGLKVLISIGILCAGLSTLEGVLLGLSTIISADIYLGVFGNTALKNRSPEDKMKSAFFVSRISYLFIGIVVYLVSVWQLKNPTGGSVVIFTMYFIYLLTAVSLIPIAAGMFIKNAKKIAVIAAASAAFISFLVCYFGRVTFMFNNPAFLGGVAIIFAVVFFVIFQWVFPYGAVEE